MHKLPLKQEVAERVEVIIPARALREIERLIADESEPVEMAINAARSQVLFRLPEVEVVATLIQGTFPNYGQLIPQSYTTRTTIDMKPVPAGDAHLGDLRAGRRRHRPDPARAGRGSGAGKLIVSARAEEIGEHRGEIDVKVEGEASKIAFNSRYLQDVLQALDDVDEVALETTSPSSPGVIRPVGDDRYVHVVMPMFVQW